MKKTSSILASLGLAFLLVLPISSSASQADTDAMLSLVPMSQVTKTVLNPCGITGRWSDPTTWTGGTLPVAGDNIHVPIGKELLIDGIYPVSIKTIRADGALIFDQSKDTEITVDTIVVTDTGAFIINGTPDLACIPTCPRFNTTINLADNGPIDRTWDTDNISRGVLVEGVAIIRSDDITAFRKLSVGPAQGSPILVLESGVIGWSVGDEVVITASRFLKKSSGNWNTQDERRTITAINGLTLTLDSGLTYSHSVSSIPVYVANITRKIVFQAEGGITTPDTERPHFMVLHQSNATVSGASFINMGRTSKKTPINKFTLLSNGQIAKDSNGNNIPGADTNPRGRYALHIHKAGLGPNQTPVQVYDNVVIGGIGWGIVAHGSKVAINNNVSYDVFGSHYVAEDGNEEGSFTNNIAIRSEGTGRIPKRGLPTHDMGHSGIGFWLETRNMSILDNVVSGVYNNGFVFFHRNTPANTANLEIPIANLLSSIDPKIAKGSATVNFSDIPVTSNKGNTVIASNKGLTIIKANGDQGHHQRTLFEDFSALGVRSGIDIQYTQQYTFKNLTLVADNTSGSRNAGMMFSNSVRDMVVNTSSVTGFQHPFVETTTFQGSPDFTPLLFTDVMVNGSSFDINTQLHKRLQLPSAVSAYNPAFHEVVDSANLVPGQLSFTVGPNQPYSLPAVLNSANDFFITGTVTDSAGTTSYSSKFKGETNLVDIVADGYYTRADGSQYVILEDLISDRPEATKRYLRLYANIVHNYGSGLGPNLGSLPGDPTGYEVLP